MVEIKAKRSILHKIVIVVLLMSMVVFANIGITYNLTHGGIIEELYKELAKSVATSLESSINLEEIHDEAKLQNYINKTMYSNYAVRELSILIFDGEKNDLQVDVSSNSQLVGSKPSEISQTAFKNKELKIDRQPECIFVATPISVNGEIVGVYEIRLSTVALDEKYKKQLFTVFAGSILVILILTVFLYLTAYRYFVKPIGILLDGAKKIADGDFTQRVKINSNDEMGLLADSFNKSADIIYTAYRDMEHKVEERVMELKETLEVSKKQNVLLERNKVAMINLLDDQKKLEADLKKEKEGIEEKVKERTRQVEEEKAKLSAAIDGISAGLMLIDVKERILTINEQMNQMFGGESGIYNNLQNILSEKIDLKEYVISQDAEQKARVIDSVEYNGKIYQLYLSPVIVNTVDNKKNIGITILAQDVTEAKIAERSKDEFFSIASHELRTPLTAIRGNTSMILEYYADKLKDEELKNMISDVHDSSVRLIEIVNDFLNLSRLEQGKMIFKKEEINMNEVVSETIGELSIASTEKQLKIEFVKKDEDVFKVAGDKDKVKQILFNLLGNSLKFTDKGFISVYMKQSDDFVKVFIEDTGRGISLSQQNILFHKFQQAGQSLFTRDTTGGTGLGLYISKLMVEGMGGQIVLEKSEENKGSVFSFSLPIAQSKKN